MSVGAFPAPAGSGAPVALGSQIDYVMPVKISGNTPAERQTLTMRMSMRRFTRLTTAFSKKLENLEHNVALYFMRYNFCRIHQSLPVTPAIEGKIADHVWNLENIVDLLE